MRSHLRFDSYGSGLAEVLQRFGLWDSTIPTLGERERLTDIESDESDDLSDDTYVDSLPEIHPTEREIMTRSRVRNGDLSDLLARLQWDSHWQQYETESADSQEDSTDGEVPGLCSDHGTDEPESPKSEEYSSVSLEDDQDSESDADNEAGPICDLEAEINDYNAHLLDNTH